MHSRTESTQDAEESADSFVNNDTYSNEVAEDEQEQQLNDIVSRMVSSYSLDKYVKTIYFFLRFCRALDYNRFFCFSYLLHATVFSTSYTG